MRWDFSYLLTLRVVCLSVFKAAPAPAAKANASSSEDSEDEADAPAKVKMPTCFRRFSSMCVSYFFFK